MPTTQKLQQKQTKATQKVGGSANPKPKKPVTKVVGGGKVASPMKTKTVKEGGMGLYDDTKKRSIRNEYLIKRNEYLIKVLLKQIYKYVVFYNKETGVKDSELNLDHSTHLDLSKFSDVVNGNLIAQFSEKTTLSKKIDELSKKINKTEKEFV
jgi:hypothetical protein